jgi:hypothetical protein
VLSAVMSTYMRSTITTPPALLWCTLTQNKALECGTTGLAVGVAT